MIYSNILLNSSKRREIKIMEENERREGVLKQHFALYAKKPSMKDCFVTVFYIYDMYYYWSFISETAFYRYEYRYDLYPWCIDYFYFDRWLSVQYRRFLFKRCFILFFSYGTEDVFPDICSWISGNFCDYAGMLCVGGNSFR